jgi:hypothetical protein
LDLSAIPADRRLDRVGAAAETSPDGWLILARIGAAQFRRLAGFAAPRMPVNSPPLKGTGD